MRIHRSLMIHIGTISRRAVVLASSSALLITGLITTAFILQRPQTTYAATPPDACFAFTSGTGTITGYYDNESNNSSNPACPRAVDIPSTIGGVTVTVIGSGAFASKQITAVTIPNTVTTIGDGGFFGNQLNSLTFGNSVTSIGYGAFQNNQLTNIVISNSINTIHSGAFQNNPLVNVSIPNSVTTMDSGTFSADSISGTLSVDMISIPNFVFGTALKSGATLILGDSVTTINDHAFQYSKITSLTIPNSVTSIGDYAFDGSSLVSIGIGSSVTTIGHAAFRDSGLMSVTIPSSVTAISDYAFDDSSLTSVIINGSPAIGSGAFRGNQVTSVIINGNPTIGDDAFIDNGLNKATIPSSLTAYTADWYDYYQTNAQFVRLYASDPAFITANTDTLYTDTSDGTTYYTTSGYLINPASVTVRYVDTHDAELRSPDVYMSDTYPDYRLSSNPTYILTPSSYYRSGNTKSFTAPAIDGYVLTSAATQSPTLTAGDNTVTFTYVAPVHTVPFATKTVVDYVATNTIPPSSVTSDLMTNSSLSIPTDTGSSCQTISDAHLVPTTDTLTNQVPETVSLLGGVDFTLHCTSTAETTVSYTLGAGIDVNAIRIYKAHNTTLTDITNDVVITTTNGLPVISYSLMDGGRYDEDGTVNGVIVDPIYIGVVNTNSTSTATLAATGANLWLLVSGALMLLGAGLVVLGRGLLRA